MFILFTCFLMTLNILVGMFKAIGGNFATFKKPASFQPLNLTIIVPSGNL